MKKAILALSIALILSALPVLFVLADPMANIKIWPEGAVHTGEPIVTTNPADMMIYTTSEPQAAHNVWVLLVLNEETYNGLNYINVNGVIYTKGEFKIPTTDWIPLEAPGSEGSGYPGCNSHEQYRVIAGGGAAGIKDKLGTTGDVYYCIKHVFDYVDTTAIEFTITFYGSSTDLKILVLALGRTNEPYTDPFDNRSSYSGSTLIVPELATILLATASLSVFGLYTLKRRK